MISLFLFILFVSLTASGSFVSFAGYGLFITGLILMSGLSPRNVLKRSLVMVPFVVAIAIFIPFFKEGQVWLAFRLGVFRISVTREGLLLFVNILIKSYLCILAMILLVSSTRFPALLKALERLGCPSIMVMILSFMYRYLFVIEDEFMKMQQARLCRSAGARRWLQVRSGASMLGVLFINSYERAEDVYLAMCARGFQGRIKTLDEFRLHRSDLYFLLVAIAALIGIRITGH
jgi:cobalt/nickel transport system permease protein